MSVYFATCREVNAVKIGSSLEPICRLLEIQICCPLLITIEAILPGGCEEEFSFHRRFADDHIRGEWFTINEMIEAIIAANPAPPMPESVVKRTERKGPRAVKIKPKPMTFADRSEMKKYRSTMMEMQADRIARLESELASLRGVAA